jgi:hypothetical protein
MALERRFVFAALMLVSLTAAAVAQQSDALPTPGTFGDSGDSTFVGRWAVTADTLVLQRSASGSQSLLTDPIPGTELFNASDLRFPMAAGPRLSLRRQGIWDGELEAVYFGIDGFRSTASFPNSALPSTVAGLSIDSAIATPVDSALFQFDSRLYSFELNYRKQLRERLTVLAGFRWVELEDRYIATGIEDAYKDLFTDTVRSHNHLYGFQIGCDAKLRAPEKLLQIDALAKVGIYGNAAGLTSDYADTVHAYSASSSGGHVAFVGELGLTASYRLSDHLAARLGYQLFWLDGVAVAPEQISAAEFISGAASVKAGAAFFHGANVGLEFQW